MTMSPSQPPFPDLEALLSAETEDPVYRPQLDEYEFDEAASALQKSIRRGLEEDAMFWAIVLEARFPWYTWKRLKVVAVEDVEDPAILMYVAECARLYKEARDARTKQRRGPGEERHLLAAAVLHLCRCKKSSINSDFAAVMFDRYEKDGERLQVPDWALDKHTGAGRKLGRTAVDFTTTGGLHANEDRELKNPYTPEYNRRNLLEAGLDPAEYELHPSISDAE